MVHVVLASDRNLIRPLAVTALSALQHSSAPMTFTFVTPATDADIAEWHTVVRLLEAKGASCEVRPVTLDNATLQMARHLTVATYYRLLLPELLPDTVTRVIYLDCDVYVGRDLAELWRMDMGGHPLAAVEDTDFHDWERVGLQASSGYFNAGVLLIDLGKVRANGDFARTLQDAQTNAHALTWSDQCALNRTFTGRWFRLDKHWNYQNCAFVEDVQALGLREARQRGRVSVVHFNNYNKPWLFEASHPLKRDYLSVASAHPEIVPPASASVRKYLVRLRRALKWQALGLGFAVR